MDDSIKSLKDEIEDAEMKVDASAGLEIETESDYANASQGDDDNDDVCDENDDDDDDDDEIPVSQLQEQSEQIDLGTIFAELISIKSELKEEIGSLKKDFRDAKSNLFSDVGAANEKCNLALDKCVQLEKRNKILEKENELLKERVTALEVYSKSDNLIKEGIAQQKDEDCAAVVRSFFSDQLKIQDAKNITFTRCHRTYSPQADKSKPIICRFLYLAERERVWAARFNLQGSHYFLKEHFPPEVNRRRSVLLPILKKAKALKMKARLQADKLVIESRPYTVKTLDQLPSALNPAEIATQRSKKYTAFFSKACPLSNFYPTPFLEIEGVKYDTVEQYLQSQKAYFANQPQIAEKIKETTEPAECKRLGDRLTVKIEEWLTRAKDIALKACRIKFRSDAGVRKFLLDTGDTTLLEAGPDKTWGIGVKRNDASVLKENSWNGENLLGTILMTVRDELKQEN